MPHTGKYYIEPKGLLTFYNINNKQELKSLALELSVASTNAAQPITIHWGDNENLYLAYCELMPGSEILDIYSHCLSRYNIHTKELETIFKSQYFDYSYLYSVVPGRPLALNSRWAVWTDGLLDKIQVYDINKREWVFSLDDYWFHSLNDNDLLVCGKTYTSIEGYSRKEFYIYDLLGNSVYTIKEDLPEGYDTRLPLEIDREKLS